MRIRFRRTRSEPEFFPDLRDGFSDLFRVHTARLAIDQIRQVGQRPERLAPDAIAEQCLDSFALKPLDHCLTFCDHTSQPLDFLPCLVALRPVMRLPP